MPEKKTIEKARKARREGKSPSTQAGAFVQEEMEHIREGKHGAKSARQAIAIGLSKARRAGVDLPPRRNGSGENGHETRPSTRAPSRARSRATSKALRREGRAAASHTALSRHAKAAAKSRTAAERSASAKKAARTRKHK